MPYPRKYDYDQILKMWQEGQTTVQIGRAVCPDTTRPHRTVAFILRNHFKIDLGKENRRKYFGTAEAYPKEEIKLWKKMRLTMSVTDIWHERRKVIPRLTRTAIYAHTNDIKGPRGWTSISGTQRLEAKRLYQTYGWHIRDIALRVGKSDSTVRKYIGQCDGYDVPARKRQPNYLIHASMQEIASRCLTRKAA